MGLVDVLKKLGILKVGTVSGTYTNAKDRPIALQDDAFMGRDIGAEPKPTTIEPSNEDTSKGNGSAW